MDGRVRGVEQEDEGEAEIILAVVYCSGCIALITNSVSCGFNGDRPSTVSGLRWRERGGES